jgi:hypothetical protein
MGKSRMVNRIDGWGATPGVFPKCAQMAGNEQVGEKSENESLEAIDLVGDAGGRESKLRMFTADMKEYSTEMMASQYIFRGWYSFERVLSTGGGRYQDGGFVRT